MQCLHLHWASHTQRLSLRRNTNDQSSRVPARRRDARASRSQIEAAVHSLFLSQAATVLELDEMQHWLSGGWSFVRFRKNKRRVWLAQCRRTRQIVAYAIGDRSETTCHLLLHWQTWKVGTGSRGLQTRPVVHRLNASTAFCFNGIMRQRSARFVWRTLSFSKNDTK